MKEILDFLNSSLGKFVIVLVILGLVGYLSLLEYQKSIYSGMTKEQVRKKIEGIYAKERIEQILLQDPQATTVGLQRILRWYDENASNTITRYNINNIMTKVGIDASRYSDFYYIEGTYVELVPYS